MRFYDAYSKAMFERYYVPTQAYSLRSWLGIIKSVLFEGKKLIWYSNSLFKHNGNAYLVPYEIVSKCGNANWLLFEEATK
jgi:hypothetical protein